MERKSDRSSHSPSLNPPPFTPPTGAEKARIEARNALRQFDAGIGIIEAAIHASTPFVLKPSQVHFLNRLATEGVAFTPGVIRPGPIEISNAIHVPPPADTVVPYLEEMCEYVNANWAKTPIHLGAYLLWRLNWIHPFEDGNGRTSRMIGYVVLCIRLGFLLPGTRTIPDQISSDKQPYYQALDAADAAYKRGVIDVSVMEELLSEMLAVQLVDVHKDATSGTLPDDSQ